MNNFNNECKISSENINFGINIGVHVLVLFGFLSLFFMMYVSELETNAFNKEIDNVIHKQIKTLPDEAKINIRKIINNVPLDNLIKVYDNKSTSVMINNDWLFNMIILVNVGLLTLLVSLISIIYVSCGQCVPIKEILIENAIIFSMVGFFEYLFFTNVAVKYVPVKPSVLLTSALESLKKYVV